MPEKIAKPTAPPDLMERTHFRTRKQRLNLGHYSFASFKVTCKSTVAKKKDCRHDPMVCVNIQIEQFGYAFDRPGQKWMTGLGIQGGHDQARENREEVCPT